MAYEKTVPGHLAVLAGEFSAFFLKFTFMPGFVAVQAASFGKILFINTYVKSC